MTIERTTQQSGVTRIGLDLMGTMRKLQDAQARLTSGKQISKLSDDPAGLGNALQLRNSIGRSQQYQRNMDDGIARLTESDRTLQQIVGDLSRIRDLAIEANNGALSSEARDAIAAELAELKAAIADAANTKYLGQPVFGGTGSTGAAYDASGTYIGDNATIERNVAPGVKVAINVNGSAVFETNGTSLFSAVQDLIDAVSSDPAAIGTAATALDDHIATAQQGLAEVGGRVNRLEALKAHTDESIASMTENLSSIEDLDLEKAILDLQTREVAYQAALSATARVIQPSLVDFLK